MRIPFRRRPLPTAPGLGPSRHAEILSFRAAPGAEAGDALISERRYAEACELYAKQASAARQLIEARVTTDVFIVGADGRTGRVARLDEGGNDVVDTSGLLGEALYGPLPGGLNLPR